MVRTQIEGLDNATARSRSRLPWLSACALGITGCLGGPAAARPAKRNAPAHAPASATGGVPAANYYLPESDASPSALKSSAVPSGGIVYISAGADPALAPATPAKPTLAAKVGRLLTPAPPGAAPALAVPGLGVVPTRLTGATQVGQASWYGSDFHGGRTANGERYDMESMTAAHRSLPFGTLIKVTNLHNSRECVLRVNNRGPFTGGRILDMSKAAARELGFVGRGVARIHMQVLGRRG